MDIGHFRERLLDKQRELLDDLDRAEADSRMAVQPEPGDPIDEATSAELQAAAAAEGSLEYGELVLVREALERIRHGTYGTCIDCGRPIEPARLEAVPWTPYCRQDQERHDAVSTADAG